MTELLRRMIDRYVVSKPGKPEFTKEAVMSFVGWERAVAPTSPSDTTPRSTKGSVAKLFVDTGAFYAMADRSDRHHVEAARTFEDRAGEDDLTTTDHVFVETWFLMRSRLGRAAAMRFWKVIETGVITMLGVTSRDMLRRPPDRA